MSLSPLVLVVLAACWTVPAVLVAVAYRRECANQKTPTTPPTPEVVQHLRIASLDVEIRKEEEKEWWAQSPAERESTTAPSPVDRSVRHAAVITPYAEVSVSVYDSHGEQCVRRCSMCLN